MSFGQNPYPQQNPPYGQAPYGAPPGSQGSAPWPGQPQGQPPAGAPGQWQQPGWPGQPGHPGMPPQPGQHPAQVPGAPQSNPWGPGGPGAPGVPGGPGAPGWGQQSAPAAPVPATPVPEPEPRTASFRRRDLLVSTTDTVGGQVIKAVLGEVVGVVTRPRQLRPTPDLAALLTQTRQDAIDAAVAMAVEAGADAVVGLRFDGGKINDQTSEVTAYGTAVTLVGGNPLGEGADENPFTTGGQQAPAEPAQTELAQPDEQSANHNDQEHQP